MRAKFATAAAAALCIMVAGNAANAQQQVPVGLWQAVDDETQQPTGWFLISDHNGVYDGIIAKMFMKPGEDPNAICDQCKDDRKDHPWLGLELIRGMKHEGDAKYAGGTILDPRDGKIYKATMKVTPDGQTLVVRGYLGDRTAWANQYWTASAGDRLQPARSGDQSEDPCSGKGYGADAQDGKRAQTLIFFRSPAEQKTRPIAGRGSFILSLSSGRLRREYPPARRCDADAACPSGSAETAPLPPSW